MKILAVLTDAYPPTVQVLLFGKEMRWTGASHEAIAKELSRTDGLTPANEVLEDIRTVLTEQGAFSS